MENPSPNSQHQVNISSPLKLVAFIYLLFIIGCFTGGIGAIVGIILVYNLKKENYETLLVNHLNYQISIFWPSFWIGLLGLLTSFFLIGIIISIVNIIWFANRTIQGFLKLNKNEFIH